MKVDFYFYLCFTVTATSTVTPSVAQCHLFDPLEGASSFTHHFFYTNKRTAAKLKLARKLVLSLRTLKGNCGSLELHGPYFGNGC